MEMSQSPEGVFDQKQLEFYRGLEKSSSLQNQRGEQHTTILEVKNPLNFIKEVPAPANIKINKADRERLVVTKKKQAAQMYLSGDLILYSLTLDMHAQKLSNGGEHLISVLSSHFFTKLLENGGQNFAEAYDQVLNWNLSTDLFRMKLTLMPICVGMHWTLAVLLDTDKLLLDGSSWNENEDTCKFYLLDSLNMHDVQDVGHRIKQYLLHRWLDVRNTRRSQVSEANMRCRIGLIEVAKYRVNIQENYYDCGTHVCVFFKRLVTAFKKNPTAFDINTVNLLVTQKEIDAHRTELLAEIDAASDSNGVVIDLT